MRNQWGTTKFIAYFCQNLNSVKTATWPTTFALVKRRSTETMGGWFLLGLGCVLPLAGFLRAYLVWLGCLVPGLDEVIQHTLSR